MINNRYVLTAAHCILGDDGTLYKIPSVRLGEWNITADPDCQILRNGVKVCADPYLDVGVEKIHIHPDYSPNNDNEGYYAYNDIALIRLVRNIHFTDFIRPICLPVRPYQRSKTYDGVALQISGWGVTEKGYTSPVKKKLTISGTEFERCRIIYLSQDMSLSPPQICAGGGPCEDAGKGDSGCPLMEKQNIDSQDVYVLVGIVSFGNVYCLSRGVPGVYTSVGAYMEWIESLLQP